MNQSDFNSLANHLGIERCDVLLVGDGSGTTVDKACGWFCWLYHRFNGAIEKHFGGTNGGTNNYAELAPYVHALWSYENRFKQSENSRLLQVCIVSDSELTVKCGNGAYGRKANGPLWASIDWFKQVGYQLHWFHVRRNTNVLSAEADHKAGLIRLLMEAKR